MVNGTRLTNTPSVPFLHYQNENVSSGDVRITSRAPGAGAGNYFFLIDIEDILKETGTGVDLSYVDHYSIVKRF